MIELDRSSLTNRLSEMEKSTDKKIESLNNKFNKKLKESVSGINAEIDSVKCTVEEYQSMNDNNYSRIRYDMQSLKETSIKRYMRTKDRVNFIYRFMIVSVVALFLFSCILMAYAINMRNDMLARIEAIKNSEPEYTIVEPEMPDTSEEELPEVEPPEVIIEEVEEPEEIMYYTENDVILIAKTLYRECRDMKSDTEKACVVWTILNRVDSEGYACGNSIEYVVTFPDQFAYYPDTEVYEEYYELSLDVLKRWNSEKNGKENVGRVLPPDYLYFVGDWHPGNNDPHNYFRNDYYDYSSVWDYSYESPYES